MRILHLDSRIVQVHETEFGIVEPKMYKPNFVIEVKNKIYIIEFQSSNVEQSILRTTRLITNIPNLDYDIGQFVKGIELILADKFIKTESIKTTVVNLLGG